ncbi:response regulator transcription factor [Azovibrio restrictus]|uniref:response regulator transcription factor n=1 Tax=Azovibrio restrictus TaxID=146938 RepID=UPI0026EF7A65|nr:response regulator transcription factor [Azovibrio restrictus]
MTIRPCHIAVVEDHEALREMTMATLADPPAWLVRGYGSAEALLGELERHPLDIVILDVNLPGASGFSLARTLRQVAPDVGILMLTVRGKVEDKLLGYDSGADLYLPKPVDGNELRAAVRALARRLQRQDAPPAPEAAAPAWGLSADGWTFMDGQGKPLPLTAQERTFLQYLTARLGEAVSRESIAVALGEDPYEYDYHRLEVLVSRLRRKALEQGVDLPLRAVRGVGYVMPG